MLLFSLPAWRWLHLLLWVGCTKRIVPWCWWPEYFIRVVVGYLQCRKTTNRNENGGSDWSKIHVVKQQKTFSSERKPKAYLNFPEHKYRCWKCTKNRNVTIWNRNTIFGSYHGVFSTRKAATVNIQVFSSSLSIDASVCYECWAISSASLLREHRVKNRKTKEEHCFTIFHPVFSQQWSGRNRSTLIANRGVYG